MSMKVDKPLKHIKPSPNEEVALIKVAESQRRQQRLIQVREQEKLAAKLLRRSVQDRKNQEIQAANSEFERLQEIQRSEQEQVVQQALDKRLQEIGHGHRSAANIPLPESTFCPKEAKKIAIKRQHAALTKLQTKKEEEKRKLTSHINARANALSMEKERSQFVISQPLPEPTIILNTKSLTRDSLKLNKVESYSMTHFHTQAFVERFNAENEENDAMKAAKNETERVDQIKDRIDREINERKEKARLRHKHAVENVLLEQDKEFIMKDLATMDQIDRQRRQKIVAKIPVQIFQPHHIRETTETEKQKQMEYAFETAHRFPLNEDEAPAFLESIADESNFEENGAQRENENSQIKVSMPSTQLSDITNTPKQETVLPDPSLHLSVDDIQRDEAESNGVEHEADHQSNKALNLVQKIRLQQEKWKERQKQRFAVRSPGAIENAKTETTKREELTNNTENFQEFENATNSKDVHSDVLENNLRHPQEEGNCIRSVAQRFALEDVLTDAAHDPDILAVIQTENSADESSISSHRDDDIILMNNTANELISTSRNTSYANLSKEEKIAAKKAQLLKKYPDIFKHKSHKKSEQMKVISSKGKDKQNPVNRYQYFHDELLKQQQWLNERQKVLEERQRDRIQTIKSERDKPTDNEDSDVEIVNTPIVNLINSDEEDLETLIRRCLLSSPKATHSEPLLLPQPNSLSTKDNSDVIAEPILKFSRTRIPPKSVIDRLRGAQSNSYPVFSPIQELPEEQFDTVDSPTQGILTNQIYNASSSDSSLMEQRLSDVAADSSLSSSSPASEINSNLRPKSQSNGALYPTESNGGIAATQTHDSSGSTAYLTAEWLDSSASMSRFEELIQRVRSMPNIQIEEGKQLIEQYQNSIRDELENQISKRTPPDNSINEFELLHRVDYSDSLQDGNDSGLNPTESNGKSLGDHTSLQYRDDYTKSTQYLSFMNQIHDPGNESPHSQEDCTYDDYVPSVFTHRIFDEGNRSPATEIGDRGIEYLSSQTKSGDTGDAETDNTSHNTIEGNVFNVNQSNDNESSGSGLYHKFNTTIEETGPHPNTNAIRNEENGFLLVMPQPVSFTSSIDGKSDHTEYRDPYWSTNITTTSEQLLSPRNSITPMHNSPVIGKSAITRHSDEGVMEVSGKDATLFPSMALLGVGISNTPEIESGESFILASRQSSDCKVSDRSPTEKNIGEALTANASESHMSSGMDARSFTAQLTSSISLPISMLSSSSNVQPTISQLISSQPRIDEADRLDNLSDVLSNISLLSFPESDDEINRSRCDIDQSISKDDLSQLSMAKENDEVIKPDDNCFMPIEKESDVKESLLESERLSDNREIDPDMPPLETTVSALRGYLLSNQSFPKADDSDVMEEWKNSPSVTMVSSHSSPTLSTQLSSFSSGNHDPLSSRSPSTWLISPNENHPSTSDAPVTLQDAFLQRKQDLLSKSENRVSNIQSAAKARQTSVLKAHEKRMNKAKSDKTVKSDSTSSFSSDEIRSSSGLKLNDEKLPSVQRKSKRISNKREMRQRTERAYSRLPEVKQLNQQRQRQQQVAINKEKAKEFQRRVREGLRRKQNESNLSNVNQSSSTSS